MSSRRQALMELLSVAGLVSLPGCGRITPHTANRDNPQEVYSAEDKALIYKFRDIGGFELYMSGFGSEEDDIHVIGIDDMGQQVTESAFREEVNTKWGGFWRPTGPYKYVDFKLYKGNTVKYHWDNNGNNTGVTGQLYGQWRVPVAERIPDDLLDDLRANPKGGMRIKFRFHPDGVLLGWDIERRPGFDPNKRDEFGNQLFVRAVHSFAGGDFREAQIINGQVVRKGWYVHPKTKQRIDLDF